MISSETSQVNQVEGELGEKSEDDDERWGQGFDYEKEVDDDDKGLSQDGLRMNPRYMRQGYEQVGGNMDNHRIFYRLTRTKHTNMKDDIVSSNHAKRIMWEEQPVTHKPASI